VASLWQMVWCHMAQAWESVHDDVAGYDSHVAENVASSGVSVLSYQLTNMDE
jgi:hypothetical protein